MSWQIDTHHSEITFKVRHLMISSVSGAFTDFKGTIEFDPSNPAKSEINVEIDPASITTRDGMRDGHLKSPDFLDVATYPTMSFKSTSIVATDDKNGVVTGDLTMHGVTHPCTLKVEFLGTMKNPASGMVAAAFAATAKLNRKDWGLAWNMGLETGGVMVGDEISISIDAELVEVPATEATKA
ncbi:MAG: YceI family protein [Chloroflexota bacterium]